MEAAAERMTPFEAAVLTWYLENCTGWAGRHGIAAEAFLALELRGETRRMFLAAMSATERAFADIAERKSNG